jgi:hypothetical protein
MKDFSKRQWLTLVVFSIADFCNAICVSLQAPFYPKEVSSAFRACIIIIIIISGVRLSPLGTAATTGLLYQPRMIGDGDCGEIGGMKLPDRTGRFTKTSARTAP